MISCLVRRIRNHFLHPRFQKSVTVLQFMRWAPDLRRAPTYSHAEKPNRRSNTIWSEFRSSVSCSVFWGTVRYKKPLTRIRFLFWAAKPTLHHKGGRLWSAILRASSFLEQGSKFCGCLQLTASLGALFFMAIGRLFAQSYRHFMSLLLRIPQSPTASGKCWESKGSVCACVLLCPRVYKEVDGTGGASRREKPIAVSSVCGHNQRHTVEIVCVFADGAVRSFSGEKAKYVSPAAGQQREKNRLYLGIRRLVLWWYEMHLALRAPPSLLLETTAALRQKGRGLGVGG